MTDKDEKDLQDCVDCDSHEGECDCGDEGCHSDIITLDMEDGTQKDFHMLEVIEFEGSQYIALAEVDSNEYDILRMDVQGETVELAVIEDDELFERVAQKFDDLFNAEITEEDDEEEQN